MRKTNLLLFIIALGLTYICSGCAGGPPNPGFRLETYYTLNGVLYDDPYRGIDLTVFRSKPPTTGQYNHFIGKRTNGAAYYDAYDGIAPADWYVYETDGDCAGQSTIDSMYPGQATDVYCNVTTGFAFWTVPNSININNPPSYVTVNGSGISAVGGMPKVQYLDQNGVLRGEVTAYSVSVDGNWARGHTPDLSNTPDGLYTMRVINPNGQLAGSSTVNIYTGDPPEPLCAPQVGGGDPNRPLCY